MALENLILKGAGKKKHLYEQAMGFQNIESMLYNFWVVASEAHPKQFNG